MNSELNRQMPHSLEAEQSLLGSILINPVCMDDIAVTVSADDFYLTEHAEIFRAMQSMYLKSKNIDVVTLIEELVQAGTYDESGGREYLRLVAEAVPTAANARQRINQDYAGVHLRKLALSGFTKSGEYQKSPHLPAAAIFRRTAPLPGQKFPIHSV